MKCPFCNKEIESNSAFCEHCGQIITTSDSKLGEADVYWNKENSKRKKLEEEYQKQEKQFELLQKYRIKKRRNIIISIVAVLVLLTSVTYFVLYVIPSIRYNKAKDLLNNENYNEALALFSKLDDYEDSQIYIKQCEDGITENNYIEAVNEYNSGNFYSASRKFLKLADYKDSNMYIANCEKITLGSAEVNDVVKFGPYDWIILEKNDGDLLLISKDFVANKIANEYSGYNKNGQFHCWSQSTLREWLNGSFLLSNFSSEEIAMLKENTIVTDEYSVDDYDGWNEEEIQVTTEDKVYIPSKADVEKYGINPMPEKTGGNYYYNDDKNNAGWLRDRGHGIAFQCTYNSDGSYGSEWHPRSSFGVWAMIRVSID